MHAILPFLICTVSMATPLRNAPFGGNQVSARPGPAVSPKSLSKLEKITQMRSVLRIARQDFGLSDSKTMSVRHPYHASGANLRFLNFLYVDPGQGSNGEALGPPAEVLQAGGKAVVQLNMTVTRKDKPHIVTFYVVDVTRQNILVTRPGTANSVQFDRVNAFEPIVYSFIPRQTGPEQIILRAQSAQIYFYRVEIDVAG